MARILYVHSRRNTFTRIDRDALEERHEVVDYLQEGFKPRPAELWRKVGECDAIVGWFASWHTALALRFARMRGKPSLLIFGGFDTAAMPEIGYGSQRGGVRRGLVRSTAKLATRLVTNSESSLREIAENVGIDPEQVEVVYHGIPDRFADVDPAAPRERMALTVGAVYEVNLLRKGHGPFCDAASLARDVEWVLAGEWWDDTGRELQAKAPQNLALTGYLSDADLDGLFRRCGVYVQASLHEGFGMSLAEAMLAGAVPVVTAAGALPEVVGETGVVIAEATAEGIAAGVTEALQLGPDAHVAARERVRTEFPYERRRDGILRELDRALAGERA
jgi:glycosyltransferase involved in cell wall biosynthesis